MTNQREIKYKVTADNSDAVNSAKGTADAFQGAATKIGAVAVGLGAAALKFANDFDSAYDTIAVGTGATGKELDGLQDSFHKVFTNVPTDMKSASVAVANFNTSLGATGESLELVASRALNASRLTGESIEAISTSSQKAFNVFELSAGGAAAGLDAVFLASQKTGQPMTKLLGLLGSYGPVLKNLNFSFAESVAVISQLEAAGLDVSRVMPGINAFMRRLASEGVQDLKGGLFDVVDQIKNATNTTEALNIATSAFGAEGAQRLTLAVRQGRLDIEEFAASLGQADGQIDKTAAVTDDWREKLTLLKNTALSTAQPVLEIGGAALTAGGSLVLMAANAGPALASLSKGIPPVLTGLRSMGRLAAAATPMMLGLGAAVGVAYAANKILGETVIDLNTEFQNLETDGARLSLLNEKIAESTGLTQKAFEKVKAAVEEDIEAKARAAERNAELSQTQEEAARTAGDFDQRVKDLSSSLEGMTEKAGDAFGALDKFKNVPTKEQIDLQAAISVNNQMLAEYKVKLDEAKAAGQDTTGIEAQIEALERESQTLGNQSTLLEANRQRTIDIGASKLAASGQVDGLVQSEKDLLSAVRDAAAQLSGQADVVNTKTSPVMSSLPTLVQGGVMAFGDLAQKALDANQAMNGMSIPYNLVNDAIGLMQDLTRKANEAQAAVNNANGTALTSQPGGRQHGGFVMPGALYNVNERGLAEFFRPSVPGTIEQSPTRSNQQSSGENISLNFNGPVEIIARDIEEARFAAENFAWGLAAMKRIFGVSS